MPIYRGNKARMDYTGLILTEELEAAREAAASADLEQIVAEVLGTPVR